MRSVDEAKQRHKEWRREKRLEEEQRLQQEKQEEQQRIAEREAQEQQRREKHEQWKRERDQMLRIVDPASSVFNYVYHEVETNPQLHDKLLRRIEEKGSTQIQLVETAPLFCGGYFYHHGLREPSFTYQGEKMDIRTDEYTTAFVARASQLNRIVQQGPFAGWGLKVNCGGRLFGRLDPIGIFGHYVRITLQERRWYHIFR